MTEATKKALDHMTNFIEAKEQGREKNRRNFRQLLAKMPESTKEVYRLCRRNIAKVWREPDAWKGRVVVICRSDRRRKPTSKSAVLNTVKLLRHPAIGYRVRFHKERKEGEEVYGILYYHELLMEEELPKD